MYFLFTTDYSVFVAHNVHVIYLHFLGLKGEYVSDILNSEC